MPIADPAPPGMAGIHFFSTSHIEVEIE